MKEEQIGYDFELEAGGYKVKMELVDMDDPLYYSAKLDHEWTLYRQINCDVDTERMWLKKNYTAVRNGVPYPDSYEIRCYEGKEILDKAFMEKLLLCILYNI